MFIVADCCLTLVQVAMDDAELEGCYCGAVASDSEMLTCQKCSRLYHIGENNTCPCNPQELHHVFIDTGSGTKHWIHFIYYFGDVSGMCD